MSPNIGLIYWMTLDLTIFSTKLLFSGLENEKKVALELNCIPYCHKNACLNPKPLCSNVKLLSFCCSPYFEQFYILQNSNKMTKLYISLISNTFMQKIAQCEQ